MPPRSPHGHVKSPRPSLTVGLLNRPGLKSVARASARALPQRHDLGDFDVALEVTGNLSDAKSTWSDSSECGIY